MCSSDLIVYHEIQAEPNPCWPPDYQSLQQQLIVTAVIKVLYATLSS